MHFSQSSKRYSSILLLYRSSSSCFIITSLCCCFCCFFFSVVRLIRRTHVTIDLKLIDDSRTFHMVYASPGDRSAFTRRSHHDDWILLAVSVEERPLASSRSVYDMSSASNGSIALAPERLAIRSAKYSASAPTPSKKLEFLRR